MNLKFLVLLIMVLLLIGTNISLASNISIFEENILYVGGNGEGNYTKIQDAIDNASDGDTIFVYDDSSPYYENIIINKSINLIGENKNTTIIDGNENYHAICLSANKINIISFTITNAHYGIKIIPNSEHIIIEKCNISNNFYGVGLYNSSNILIKNCIIFDNINGIIFIGSDNSYINDCAFLNRQKCLWFDHSNNNRVTCCTFSLSISGHCSDGIYFYSSSDNKIQHCKIYKVYDGISFYNNSNHNEIENCSILNTYDRGIVFSNADGNHILNSIISNNYGEFDGYAVEFFSSHNNFIEGCIISNNSNGGISITSSSYNNYIYKNNFVKNLNPSYDNGHNVWDSGIYGNYWDIYTGVDDNYDGIGDIPQKIEGIGNQDNFPLMFPYGPQSGVMIIAPREGFLYVRNLKILPFFTTVILGNIKIETIVANYIYGIEKVEFYIDDILRKTDTDHPYDWRWRLSSHIRHRHTIKVVAYDTIGASVDDELKVWRFF